MPDSCNPMDSSPPDFSLHEISKARIIEWVAIYFSRRTCWPRVTHRSPALQAESLLSEPTGKPLKFICSHKNSRNTKANLRKKNKVVGITFPDFRQYCSYNNQNNVILHKNRHMDQSNRIENIKINLYTYG